MVTVTIPKALATAGELVLIPRHEYQKLLRLRRNPKPEITLSPDQKKALVRARRNLARGRYLTVDELEHKLGAAN